MDERPCPKYRLPSPQGDLHLAVDGSDWCSGVLHERVSLARRAKAPVRARAEKQARIPALRECRGPLEAAADLLSRSGAHIVLPNLHSNEATSPGLVASVDLQRIILGIY